jgi:hypothetical protein
MGHTLTGKRAQAPERAHRLLAPSAGLAVDHRSAPIAAICVGDGNFRDAPSNPIGQFGGYSTVPHAAQTRARA